MKKKIGNFSSFSKDDMRYGDFISVYFNTDNNHTNIIWESTGAVGGMDTFGHEKHETIKKNVDVFNSKINMYSKTIYGEIIRILSERSTFFKYSKRKDFEWYLYTDLLKNEWSPSTKKIYGLNANNIKTTLSNIVELQQKKNEGKSIKLSNFMI